MFSLLPATALGGEEEETGLDESRLRPGDSETSGSSLEPRIEGQALGEGVTAMGKAKTERGRLHL